MTVIGTLNFRDWDEGCMKTLGAEIATYVVDGDSRQVYAVDVPGMESSVPLLDNKVPCHFINPEDVYQGFYLPSFNFRQSDMNPSAFERQPWYQWVARGPAKDAEKVVLPDGRVGYTKAENQFRANPMDISYDLIIAARRRNELNLMKMWAFRHFIPPSPMFKVVDSLGEVRQYDAVEMSYSDTSELADIADRMISCTISFTVRAEIDLYDEREYPAMLAANVTYHKFNPGEIDPDDPMASIQGTG